MYCAKVRNIYRPIVLIGNVWYNHSSSKLSFIYGMWFNEKNNKIFYILVCHCWHYWNYLKFGWLWWHQIVYRIESDFECFKQLQSLLRCYQFDSLPVVYFEYAYDDRIWISYWRTKKHNKKKIIVWLYIKVDITIQSNHKRLLFFVAWKEEFL